MSTPVSPKKTQGKKSVSNSPRTLPTTEIQDLVTRSRNSAIASPSTSSITVTQDPELQPNKSQTNARDPHAKADFQIKRAVGQLHAKADFQAKNLSLVQLTLENLETQVSNINEALIDIGLILHTNTSHIHEAENKSSDDSNENEYSTTTDNADVSNEDKDLPLSTPHENFTERATRNDNKHVTEDDKVNSIDLPKKVTLTKRPEPSENIEERLLTIARDYPKIANRTNRYPTQLNSNQYKFADAVLIKEPADVDPSKGYVIGHTAEHCHVVFEPINLAMRELRVDAIHNNYVFLESLLREFLQQKRKSNQI